MKNLGSIFCFMLATALHAQNVEERVERPRDENTVRVVFYNVENIFDTINDANVRDEEFLPDAEKGYDTRKYRIKVANTAKTIRAVGGWQVPEIVGVAEIENRGVLLDIADHMSVKNAHFEVVHYDSPDARGIDVGLLYNSKKVKILYSAPLEVRIENSRTRDVLYTKCLVLNTDTLHVFVNHWSSRYGGKAASEHKRISAAKTVKIVTDSLQKNNPQANIIIMGDFNDAPTDNSLGVLTNPTDTLGMKNLMADLPVTSGSHKYRGVWEYLDQFIVAKGMVTERNSIQVYDKNASVFKADYLATPDDKYGDVYPFRSWKGAFFTGGFSDHFPIFCDLIIK